MKAVALALALALGADPVAVPKGEPVPFDAVCLDEEYANRVNDKRRLCEAERDLLRKELQANPQPSTAPSGWAWLTAGVAFVAGVVLGVVATRQAP